MEMTIATNGYSEIQSMNQVFERIKTDLNIFHAYQLMQTAVIFITLIYGFYILMFSLFARRQTTVWGLWVTLLCGFVQVCYCAANVLAARQREIYQGPAPFQCSDIYTIPFLCDVISMAALVSSAVGVTFSKSKIGLLLRLILFPYILVCTFCAIAVNSGQQLHFTPERLYITQSLSFQPVSCSNSRQNDLFLVAFESLLIYVPLGITLLLVNYRSEKTTDDGIRFFKQCNLDCSCFVCQYQNSVCKVVIASFSVCMLILRPIDVIISSVYDFPHQNIVPSLVSTAVYVYLCFEYSVILQNNCKISVNTQTDKVFIESENEAVFTVSKEEKPKAIEVPKELLIPFNVPACV